MFDVSQIRTDFPILARKVNEKPLVYLDNGASSQKPDVVIDAVKRAYSEDYANVHRGLHYLSNLSTEKYESVRGVVARFLNASDENEIVLNSGTTEGINMVAYGWAMEHLKHGDNIVLSIMEHHANIVPWHFLRERMGIELKWVNIDDHGNLDPQSVIDAIDKNTKLVAVTHMSNVLGTIVDVKTICHAAKSLGVATLVDGSQGAVHMPVDVQALDADFYVFSAHKLYGPNGVGILWGKAEILAELPPFLGGGDMIDRVTIEKSTYALPPHRFEAGTPAIAETIALGAAVDYVQSIGMEAIRSHEQDVLSYAHQRLLAVDGLRLIGTAVGKSGVVSFTMDCAHPHDISTIIDNDGVAIRAGHHCAQPLMDFYDLPSTARASVGVYTTREEFDALAISLEKVNRIFA